MFWKRKKRSKDMFPESALAHKWLDGLRGLEIGPSAQNPFGLKSRMVGLKDNIYEEEDKKATGTSVRLDINARADDIPIKSESEDYILSSHVIEHCPNMIKTMLEWYRVIRKDGFIFMIVPHRDAAPSDVGRPLTTWSHLGADYLNTITEHDEPEAGVFGHCHYHVFEFDTMKEFIGRIFNNRLVLVDSQNYDDKIGNGFTLVYQKMISLNACFPWDIHMENPEHGQEMAVKLNRNQIEEKCPYSAQ